MRTNFDDLFYVFDYLFYPQITKASFFKTVNDKYELQVIAPGYEKEDLSIEIIGDYLKVSAKNDKKVVKSFLLPEDVSVTGIEATLKNGILKITLGKKEATPNIKVEIK